MPIERRPLTDQCRTLLMRRALTPAVRSERMEDLATEFGVSRTPVRDAVRALESIGLVKSTPYRGVEPRFTGRAELRQRIQILTTAAGVGFAPAGGRGGERVARVVGGDWGAVTWELILSWPDSASAWGIDLRPKRDAILQQLRSVESAVTPAELSTALHGIHELY